MRDQISKVEPKTKEIEEALAQSNFKEWVEGGWEEEGEEGATQPHSVNDGTAAGNAAMTYMNVQSLGVKGLVKKTAKDTGKNIVKNVITGDKERKSVTNSQ